jgi:rhodanese-related sulfurtransferase
MSAKPLILDVRTPQEFHSGHAPGSINIPLDELGVRLGALDPNAVIHACCAGGGRSQMAKRILDGAGFRRVSDAGSWQNAQRLASIHGEEGQVGSF